MPCRRSSSRAPAHQVKTAKPQQKLAVRCCPAPARCCYRAHEHGDGDSWCRPVAGSATIIHEMATTTSTATRLLRRRVRMRTSFSTTAPMIAVVHAASFCFSVARSNQRFFKAGFDRVRATRHGACACDMRNVHHIALPLRVQHLGVGAERRVLLRRRPMPATLARALSAGSRPAFVSDQFAVAHHGDLVAMLSSPRRLWVETIHQFFKTDFAQQVGGSAAFPRDRGRRSVRRRQDVGVIEQCCAIPRRWRIPPENVAARAIRMFVKIHHFQAAGGYAVDRSRLSARRNTAGIQALKCGYTPKSCGR